MRWQDDQEYEDKLIMEISRNANGWWSLRFDDGSGFGVERIDFEPKPGDTARLFGQGFGSICRGIVINGRVCFYRTPEEQRAKNEQDWRDRRRKLEIVTTQRDTALQALKDLQKQRTGR